MNTRTTISKLFLASAVWLVASASAQQPSPPALRATAVLGVESAANGSVGDLSIREDALVFSRHEGLTVDVPLTAIQTVFLSQQERQVGGAPMAVGRTVAPFGGGRVIGLFSHKKYDFFTVEYADANGAFHATIYQLKNGDGQALAKTLGAKGVRVSGLRIDIAKNAREKKNAQ